MGIIRVLLALFVIVTHSESFFGLHFTGGKVAVELFFIISGFYMTMILNEKYKYNSDYIIFIKNRFLKIYPAYWTILFLTFFVSLIVYFALHNKTFAFNFYVDNEYLLNFNNYIFLIFSNIFIFFQDAIMFLSLDGEGMFFTSDFSQTQNPLWKALFIGPAWSLGIELLFYIVAPFIVRRKISIIIILISISFIIRFYIYYILGYTNDPWTHRFFPSELALFLFGTLSYHIYKKYTIKNKYIYYIIFLFILINLIGYEFFYNNKLYYNNWFLYIIFSFSLPFIFQLFKNNKFDRIIGDYSYPIYISHLFIMSFVNFILTKLHLLDYLSELTFLTTFIFSFLLIKYIINPIEKIRQSNIRELNDNS